MANKAQINPVEQKTMVQGQTGNLNYKPIMTNAQIAQGLSEMANGLSNVIYEQSKRIEKLKFADNDEKLKITSAEMNLALSKAKDQAEFDAIKKDYTDRMKAESKARLGKSFDKWNNLEGNNFMSAMEVDVKQHQIALNDKIAKETATSTIKDMAYQWGYAPTEEARRMQDEVFNDYLANSDFNVAEQEAYKRKYDHDKEHGYLTQLITKNPAKVKSLLADPKNFDNLTIEERESFKHTAETAEKELKKALDKGFDDNNSLKIASVKAEQINELNRQIANIKSAGTPEKLDIEKLSFQDIMGTLDYITSLAKDPLKINKEIIMNPSGQVTYTLSQEEAIKYKSQLFPYLFKATNAMLDGETGVDTNSVFAEQLARLTEAAKKSGTMTAYEISDLMTAIWRENQKDEGMKIKDADGNEKFYPVHGQGWATRNLKDLNRGQRDEALRAGMRNVKTVMDEFYMKRGNTGVALWEIPPEITTTFTDEGGVVFQSKSEKDYYESLKDLNEWKNNLRKDNPLLYSANLAADKKFI